MIIFQGTGLCGNIRCIEIILSTIECKFYYSIALRVMIFRYGNDYWWLFIMCQCNLLTRRLTFTFHYSYSYIFTILKLAINFFYDFYHIYKNNIKLKKNSYLNFILIFSSFSIVNGSSLAWKMFRSWVPEFFYLWKVWWIYRASGYIMNNGWCSE